LTAPPVLNRLRTARHTIFDGRSVIASLPTTPIKNKVRPPTQRIEVAAREPLLDRLDRSVGAAITVLQSPAGFGKTVLLGQWYQRLRARDDMRVAWVTLDESDREVTRLLADIASALVEGGLAMPASLQAPAQSFSAIDRRRDELCAAIERDKNTVVLILDDYHRAASTETNMAVDRIARDLGSAFHLVVSSRDPVPFGIADLEARGLVAHVGASDLTLPLDEARPIFGTTLDDRVLRLLHDRTEGWPVALQLVKLWLERDVARKDALATFSGRSEALTRYLLEQVIGELDAHRRALLLDCSVLETFDAALLDQIRERSDSRQLLAKLRSFDALLIPLDVERRWFRLHHLFGDFLNEQLRLSDDERAAALHRRAAGHFARRGELDSAVRHAIAGNDDQLAARLVRDEGGWELVLARGIGPTRGVLARFDAATLTKEPSLLRIQGYLEMKFGALDEARRLIDAAARLPQSNHDRRDGVIVEALLRTYADDHVADEHRRRLEIGLKELDPADHLGRGTMHASLAVVALGRGDFVAAEREATEGENEMMTAQSPLGVAYCQFHRAQSHVQRGQLAVAEDILRTTLVDTEERSGGDSALKAIGNGLLGSVLVLTGDVAEAQSRLAEALPAIEAHDSWSDVLATAYDAAIRLHRATGENSAALDLIDRCDVLAGSRQLRELSLLTRAWRIETLVSVGNVAAAAALAGDLPGVGGWRFTNAHASALGQFALRSGRSAEALRIFRSAREAARLAGHPLAAAQMALLVATACRARGDEDGARQHLIEAIEAAAAWRAPGLLDWQGGGEALLAPIRLADLSGAARELLTRKRQRRRDDATALSRAELAVLAQLALGRGNKEIGRQLDLSENTVKFHLKHIFDKLGVSSRAAAVTTALRRGLIAIS
jgi:LuxR family maltose regulon positive regulatory protein